MRVLVVMGLLFLGLVWPSDGHADLYCNGTDSTLQADCLTGTGNVLHYDDFEDGTAVCTFGEKNNAANDGWGASVFAAGCGAGCANGTSMTVIGESNCWGRAGGAAGTSFAAYSGFRTAGSANQTPMMMDHNFNQDVTEFYSRVFVKFTSNHDFGGNMKLIWTVNNRQGNGAAQGILWGDHHGDDADVNDCAPYYDFIPGNGVVNGATALGRFYQNQGNDLKVCANDHWYRMEIYKKLSSPAGSNNGVYRFYLDDCGVSGTECAGVSPTLRASYNAVSYQSNANYTFGNLWYETYQSPSNVDIEVYYDEVLTMKTGPIGNLGLGAGSPNKHRFSGGMRFNGGVRTE